MPGGRVVVVVVVAREGRCTALQAVFQPVAYKRAVAVGVGERFPSHVALGGQWWLVVKHRNPVSSALCICMFVSLL